jgi:precorrin-8X/cobalt-precorrin-8 methylmutase
MAAPYSYIRDPAAIYRASQAAVEQASDLSRVPDDLRGVAIRMVHACGMPEILTDLVFSPNAGAQGRAALAAGAAILADSRMVADGIIRARLPRQNRVLCAIEDPAVSAAAKRDRITRSAAAVDLWRPHLAGSIVVIGNAPTALFRLLELLAEGAPAPALIIGLPVGFVGAAEAKARLIADAGAIPYVTLRGRFGGSALAAAALNGLTGDLAGDGAQA